MDDNSTNLPSVKEFNEDELNDLQLDTVTALIAEYKTELESFPEKTYRTLYDQVLEQTMERTEQELKSRQAQTRHTQTPLDPFSWTQNRSCIIPSCSKRSLPFSEYCSNHITLDQHQLLYETSHQNPQTKLSCSVTGCLRPPLSAHLMSRLGLNITNPSRTPKSPPQASSTSSIPSDVVSSEKSFEYQIGSLCTQHCLDLIDFDTEMKQIQLQKQQK
ncbi:hypothetical protein BLNAU_12631 [Blattamonas nauphoetae]|uniref:KANL2-like probable zinc-finger domain-containing protein n=1 Tax=Blattamonas nauphoetae TaxID=2049346 RepID=A0ABQ9XKV6_9EUKA|nr:hypothetical protein BLNAU_12631 [Blattamonas nauphoetae]